MAVSPQAFNRKTGLVLICPVPNQVKGYPFEVSLDAVPALSGVILADQVRSLDWRTRAGESITRIPESLWADMAAKIRPLLEAVDYGRSLRGTAPFVCPLLLLFGRECR